MANLSGLTSSPFCTTLTLRTRANQSWSRAYRLIALLLVWIVCVLLMVDADLFSGLASRLNGFIYVDDYWIG
jgi:membrane-anchored protein YejM (alkaline phosphatase superfamily)